MKNIDIDLFQKRLLEIDRIMGLRSRSDATCCGVTLPQCHTIMEIGTSGPMPLKILSQSLGLDKSTLSRTVDGLVSIGLLQRATAPNDRRSIVIDLSKKGRTLFERINSGWTAYYKALYKNIPADKQSQVTESLALIIESFEKTHINPETQTNCRCKEPL